MRSGFHDESYILGVKSLLFNFSKMLTCESLKLFYLKHVTLSLIFLTNCIGNVKNGLIVVRECTRHLILCSTLLLCFIFNSDKPNYVYFVHFNYELINNFHNSP